MNSLLFIVLTQPPSPPVFMLYLVATPIGNLADITFRAIETLKSVDYILCEDTRHSLTLLQHYTIHKPLKSYHKFNIAYRQEEVIADLQNGKNVALISDAGTPGISDPGEELVRACNEHNIPVTSIPGPCAAVAALTISGLGTERFQFWGFLPRKAGELKKTLQEILTYTGTTICYESPHRLMAVLESLAILAPQRTLFVARELTKKFEERVKGTAAELIAHWEQLPLKGEIVLIISGAPPTSGEQWDQLTPQEHVKLVQETYHLDKKEAIKIVAEIRGVPKREIYQSVIESD